MFSVYTASHQCRIVLTGTDSPGLAPAAGSALYDRLIFIPTTYMSYGEFHRITGASSIDEFIRHGSVLSDDIYDDCDSTRQYIETSIVDNIVSSCSRADRSKSQSYILKALDDLRA